MGRLGSSVETRRAGLPADMTIWGKIIGGAAGFAIGGPLGALMGAVAGHAVDDMVASPDGEAEDGTKTIAFTVGVVVLGAKMAKADGVVHRLEVDAFRRAFQVPPDEFYGVQKLFDVAKRDSAGFEPYARQLARMFKDRRPVLDDLMGCLFHIATADGRLHAAELEWLHRVAGIFGFSEAEWEQTRRIHGGERAGVTDPLDDPYAVLGLPRTASFEEVKAAYRRLVREHHPDAVMAQGLPPEFVAMAQETMAAINAAYEKIEARAGERGNG